MRLSSARISSRSESRKWSVPIPIPASRSPLEGMALVIKGTDKAGVSAAGARVPRAAPMPAAAPAATNSRRERDGRQSDGRESVEFMCLLIERLHALWQTNLAGAGKCHRHLAVLVG